MPIKDQPPSIPNTRKSIADLVMADLEDRKVLGIQRYGVALQAFNGRDPLIDLYQEQQDALLYTRQWIEERSELLTTIDLLLDNVEESELLQYEARQALSQLKELRKGMNHAGS